MPGRVWRSIDITRQGDHFSAGGLSTSVVRDQRYPTMWRVRRPDGSLTNMVNHTRAVDAAKSLLLAALNLKVQESPAERRTGAFHREDVVEPTPLAPEPDEALDEAVE